MCSCHGTPAARIMLLKESFPGTLRGKGMGVYDFYRDEIISRRDSLSMAIVVATGIGIVVLSVLTGT